MELQMPIFDLSLSSLTTATKGTLILLLLCIFSQTNAERDFNYNDSQVPLLEPKDEPHHLQDPYLLELSHCQHSDSEIILSLILKKHDWQDLSDNKRTKLQGKLSKFFAIPKEIIVMDSITKNEMHAMQKISMRHGNNKSHFTKKYLGRVSFQIGCGASYFQMGQPISKQISSQMKDGSLDNITGEKFGWWIIWRKQLKNRAHRNRRQIEGSGEDYDYEDEEDEEQEQVENITELPTAPTHAHRHHHGDNAENKPELTANTFATNAEEVVEEGEIAAPAKEEDAPPLKNDGQIDEEIVESVSQLESVITKTIENTKNLKELPVIADVIDVDNDDETANNAVPHTEDVPDTPQIVKDLNTPVVMEEFNNEILVQHNNDNKFDLPDEDINNEDELILPATTQRSTVNSIITPKLVETDNDADIFEELTPVQRNFNIAEVIESTTKMPTTTPNIGATIDLAQVEVTSSTLTSTTATPQIIAITTTNNILQSQESSASTLSQSSQLSPYSPYDASSASVSSSSSSSVVGSSTTISPDIPVAITIMPTKQHHHTYYDESVFKEINTVDSSTDDVDDDDDSDTEILTTTISYFFAINSHDTTTHANPQEADIISSILTTTNIPSTAFIDIENSDKKASNESSIDDALETNRAATSTSLNPHSEDNNRVLPSSSSAITSTTPSITQRLGISTPLPDMGLSSTTFASTDYVEPKIENTPPMIKTRLQKFAVTSGKSFRFTVPDDTFIDTEDNTNLRLELTDKDGHELKQSSWLQFNVDKREIYGLPLDDAVSKWQYRLTATDSGNESVTETLEISVQQHRGVRTVNHEINIGVKINEKGMHNIDWQLKLLEAIAETLADDTVNSIVVREIRQTIQDPHTATFAYFNETLPTTECPEAELNNLVKRLDASRLTELVQPTLGIKSITGSLIGTCQKTHETKPKQPTHIAKNFPPMPRNQVDRVNATVGHLLVYKVPSDTFYDPNDSELKLTLKTKENKELNSRHWLQFDSKNQEFYGIPKSGDIGSEEYLLVAEDSGGLTATDALVVVVSHAPKKEFSVFFKAYLAIRHEQFNADLQRKFVERVSALHGDNVQSNIQIRSVTTHHDSDGTIVNFYNTTLYKMHNRCPEREIDATRNVYLHQDYSLRDRVKKALGPELNLTNVSVIALGSCHPQTDVTHREFIPTKTDEPLLKSTFSEEYMTTIILPAVIIIAMILVASIIACCLHRRRVKSGKMELGDEEERKSFHTKGIPVIFQDELDEKPEMGNKSPIILENEKPPLLPPSYNTANMNGDNDVDEYVPPPAVVVGGGREVRGKSPATPSYRKPPPYVSP